MITIEQLEGALRDGGLNFSCDKEKNEIVLKHHSSKYNFDNFILLEVSDDNEYVDVYCFAFTFEELSRSVLNLINELNGRFKFFSFYVDDDNRLILHSTAIVKENNSIDEAIELVARATKLMDDIYPDVQRIIWK